MEMMTSRTCATGAGETEPTGVCSRSFATKDAFGGGKAANPIAPLLLIISRLRLTGGRLERGQHAPMQSMRLAFDTAVLAGPRYQTVHCPCQSAPNHHTIFEVGLMHLSGQEHATARVEVIHRGLCVHPDSTFISPAAA